MKKNLLRYALIAVILCQSFAYLIADDEEDDPLNPKIKKTPFLVGPVIGYNKVMHSVTLETSNIDAVPCPSFQNGSSNGFFVGASAEFLLGGPKNSKSSVIVRLLYNTFPAKMEQQSFNAGTGGLPSVKPDGTSILTDVLYTNAIAYNTISLDLAYKFNFMDNLGVVAGPTFDYAMTATQNQRTSLISDPKDGAAFKMVSAADQAKLGISYTDFANPAAGTAPKTIIVKQGDIPGKQSLRIALKLGLQYEILTKGGMIIVPGIAYNFGVTNVDDHSWKVSAIQIGVDVRFALK
jgi:hypothetical protein